MWNYYYIVWIFYFTYQKLSTVEIPDVKISGRHVLLPKYFNIGNKNFYLDMEMVLYSYKGQEIHMHFLSYPYRTLFPLG